MAVNGHPDPPVRFQLDATGVATLTIDRPDRRNALSWEVVRELRRLVARCRTEDDVRVVVLTGAGDVAFCAGADLSDMGGAEGHLVEHDSRGELAALFEDLWSLGKPTIARVRGYALAGGMGLALSCDLVVAADDARFGTPEIRVGLWPFMITVPLLRSLSPRHALDLMMTGRQVDAAEAQQLGIVNRVVSVELLDAEVAALAADLAAASPVLMRLGRDSFYAVTAAGAAQTLAYLQAQLSVALGTEDASEGLAAFADKRRPQWKGG